jgi:hypothetical protein
MGRKGKVAEEEINRKILNIIQRHSKTGITFGDLLKEAKERTGIVKDTMWQHLMELCKVGAVDHQGRLYFVSRVWAQYEGPIRAKTGYTSSKLGPDGNLYVGLLIALASITHQYLALLQAIANAPDISAAHDMADFFLRNAGDSEIMALVRRVWESKGNVALESLIGKKLTLEFVKGQPPAGGVSVRAISPTDKPSVTTLRPRSSASA